MHLEPDTHLSEDHPKDEKTRETKELDKKGPVEFCQEILKKHTRFFFLFLVFVFCFIFFILFSSSLFHSFVFFFFLFIVLFFFFLRFLSLFSLSLSLSLLSFPSIPFFPSPFFSRI